MGDHEATRAQISCCTTTLIQVRCACRPIFSTRCSATRAHTHSHTLRSRVLIRQPGNTQRSPRSDLLISRTATFKSSPREMARAPPQKYEGILVWLSWAGGTDRGGSRGAFLYTAGVRTSDAFRPTIVSPHCHPAATGGSADSQVFDVIW